MWGIISHLLGGKNCKEDKGYDPFIRIHKPYTHIQFPSAASSEAVEAAAAVATSLPCRCSYFSEVKCLC